MTTITPPGTKQPNSSIPTIIKAGLLAGTLDICSAFIYSYIKRGTAPQSVLQYVSKVALGKSTFSPQDPLGDPTVQAITGLLVHFTIAMSWAFIFFILYRNLKWMRQNKILTGILYGLLVWTVMNVILLPLWNNKPFVFNPENSTINALILIVAIGLPLSFMAHRHYSKKM